MHTENFAYNFKRSRDPIKPIHVSLLQELLKLTKRMRIRQTGLERERKWAKVNVPIQNPGRQQTRYGDSLCPVPPPITQNIDLPVC